MSHHNHQDHVDHQHFHHSLIECVRQSRWVTLLSRTRLGSKEVSSSRRREAEEEAEELRFDLTLLQVGSSYLLTTKLDLVGVTGWI